MTADTLAHVRDNPWYGTGVAVDGAMTVEEALDFAGLNWEVGKYPAVADVGQGTGVAIPDRYAILRTDTHQFMGHAGKLYVPQQNREVFDFANHLVDGGLLLDSAGTYRNGRRVFLVAKVPGEMQVLGEDAYDLYLFMTTGHDGHSAVTFMIVPVRISCRNMFNLALRSARTIWRANHTTSFDGKVQEAREALALTFAGQTAFQLEMEKLAETTLASDVEVEAVVEKTLGRQATEARIERVTEILRESPTIPDAYRDTRYGALQAFGEWCDWLRPIRTEDARANAAIDGHVYRWKNRFYQALTAA